jgi:selenoprotein W-related protein
LTATVLNALKQQVQSWTLVPSRGGCFEVTVDGKLIYSKLETDAFPREADILDQLTARAKKAR